MGKNLLTAEIIAIGNEVVDGTVINSNAAWLSQALSLKGLSVLYHTAIPDDEKLMLEAFERASNRADWVLVTGGLGPTVDDFTLEVAAKFFRKDLVADPVSLKTIRDFFKKLDRKPTPNQEKQAYLPQGAQVLSNGVGTAPGAYLEFNQTHFAFFPGVPKEMHLMFEEGFLPLLKKQVPDLKGRQLKVLSCFGLAEGQMDYQLRKDLKG
ncbi:MAG: competence/damage-inducible protein A, partial [Deltaproteobacteria bacterium]|nr:competence/damage-inducible protein A [Deltaproteobacteria bacterium]